ncbi:MAG: Hsp20/alpha crystallin family protein [Anaerolineae bacterium]|nr:MAG: Hsp20/alpha crystallin family protein [Anaerolineae bacterium]
MPSVTRKPSSSRESLVERQHNLLHAMGWAHIHVRSNVWSPPTDMYETEKAYIVRVEIAGMREEDFLVSVEGDYLVVSGVRQESPERRAYHQMEIRFGKFVTVIGIPGPVDVDQAQAEYENGFLVVTLPKAQPNRISVKDDE